MGKTGIIGVLLITTLFILGACATPPEPTPTPTPEPAPEESLTAPELVSPHNRATDIELKPIFLWESVPEAGGYELRISQNSNFSDIVVEVPLSDTSYELVQYLAPLTRYYWIVGVKMNPENPDDPVAYSQVWSFTTAESSEPSSTPTKPPLPTPDLPPPGTIKITAAQLSTEYDEIGLAAETQYKNRELEVSGTLDYFGIAAGSPFISFETAPDAWEIRAFLAEDQVSKAETLAKGDEIVVIGTCRGSTVWAIILSDCQIIVP